ncbi:hypothetical protein [Paludisphaera rhizosphaerae]|uniref:hypothetical protein n=1 Tax=Paludisphaera rhizosphaerae TaxID=2711216 RepID=UPI0013ECCD7C|nr:hypothetical protein [Paludisphaera rhizosphaerae]
MMNNRIEGPVETWRGIDPEWRDCGGLSYNNLLVRAPCGEVVQALLEDREMPKRVADLLMGPPVEIRQPKSVLFAYQFQGHEWTQIEDGRYVALDSEIAQRLSRRLNAQAFIYGCEDVASARYYEIYERGELMESFSWLHDNPIYQGDVGEEDLRRKRVEGWQVSNDHTFEFFTRRGAELDVESPKACYDRLDRVVAELGMFVASSPFWLNEKPGRVERPQHYDFEPFAEAKVLYRIDADLPHRR